jgi:hypothetical protein
MNYVKNIKQIDLKGEGNVMPIVNFEKATYLLEILKNLKEPHATLRSIPI